MLISNQRKEHYIAKNKLKTRYKKQMNLVYLILQQQNGLHVCDAGSPQGINKVVTEENLDTE